MEETFHRRAVDTNPRVQLIDRVFMEGAASRLGDPPLLRDRYKDLGVDFSVREQTGGVVIEIILGADRGCREQGGAGIGASQAW